LDETLFTILKGRQVFGHEVPLDKLWLFLDVLGSTRNLVLADLDIEAWKIVVRLELPELQDRMIVATHIRYNSSAVLTDDPEIVGAPGVRVIWR